MPEPNPTTRRRRPPGNAAQAPDGRRPRRPRGTAADAARDAVAQSRDLIGHDVEGVISVERTEDGWTVGLEVVETHRIPSSTDVLAVYEVQLDADGDLLSYRRVHRYCRGQTTGRSQ